MSNQAVSDLHIRKAAELFWGAVANAFPEVTTGDSQISGEDQAALALWCNGDPGDRPVHRYTLDIPEWITESRVLDAVNAGLQAAARELFPSGDYPAVGEEVLTQLDGCVRHILHFNLS